MKKLVLTRDNREIPLDLPMGYFMCWNFTTQAENKAKVKLYDENIIYFEEERQSRNPLPIISGSGRIIGSQMWIAFDVPDSVELKIRMETWELGNSTQTIAKSIIILVEDQDDNDYNDIVVNITAWISKG